jgi:O-antigen/teichoic acid export membrane protein
MSPPSSLTGPADAGFADRVRSAVFWRWGSQVASQIITWTTTILVVRLLDPHDYGLFAMSQALVTALNFLNGYSFATSLIQAREVDERRIGQVFGLLIVANVLLATAQLIMAPLAAHYYGQPQVADMLRIQALVYLATPFIALPSALLARGLQFRSQALVNLACAVAGAAVALALAATGHGVWALVWAPIAIFSVRALGLTIAAGGLVRPIFDFRGSRDIIGFGAALTFCQLFWIIQSQSDIVIAGRSLTPHELGLYSEALFLTLIFTGRFLPSLNEVAFPAYSELRNAGKSVSPAFISSVRMTMLVAAPFYIGLSLVAGPLVETFFGPKWLEMIPIVAGLALAMPAMALQIICSPATNALGRPSIYLMTSAAGAVIMPVAFAFGVVLGPHGLVLSWQVAAPLLLAATLAFTLPAIGARLTDLIRALAPAAFGCAAMALAVTWLASEVSGLGALTRLFTLTGAGAATYLAALWLAWPGMLRDGWNLLRRPRAAVPAE